MLTILSLASLSTESFLTIENVVAKYAWVGDMFYQQKILSDYGECSKSIPIDQLGKAKWAIEKIKDIFRYIDIPIHLEEVGIQEKDIDDIVKDTTGSSLANNPRNTDENTLKEILFRAL